MLRCRPLMRTRLAFFAFALAVSTATNAIEAYRLGSGEKIVMDGSLDDAPWAKAQAWTKFYEL